MRFLYLILALLSIVAFVRGGNDSKKEKNVCNQRMDAGNALGNFPRFYFNKKEKKCLEFTYGGVGGNGNNFESLKECNRRCICSLPLKKGKKGKGSAEVERWYFDQKENACKSFTFKGAKGNSNNFETLDECLKACGKTAEPGVEEPYTGGKPSTGEEDVCKLPKEVGKGKAKHRRWYYNGQVCKKFNFKGRKGNGNNFMSKQECREACVDGNSNGGKPSTGGENVCEQPKEEGPGRALIERYYFDQNKQKCKKFFFGGQGGNGNNFMSMKECKKACVDGNSNGGKPSTGGENVCELPKVAGDGKAKKKRYYFDQKKNKCRKFNYGGKGGNGNNFKSMKKCKEECLKGEKPKGKKKCLQTT